MEQNEQNLQSATDSQNDAFRKNEVAQSNLKSAKEDYKKAVASGDKNAIKQARQNVKDAQDVADGTANELNERTSNLARVQQDTRIDNRRLEARINERNDVHDILLMQQEQHKVTEKEVYKKQELTLKEEQEQLLRL